MFELLLLINISATVLMTGLIWFVQIVHYPGFLHVDHVNFQNYHQFHVPQTGLVVAVPMLIELATSVLLVIIYPQMWGLNLIGLCMVVGIWVSTGMLQARYHYQLQSEPSREVIKLLIQTNWIRTVLWSAKGILGGYMMYILI